MALAVWNRFRRRKSQRDLRISKPRAAQAVDIIIDWLKESLMMGRRIELRGFGTFLVGATRTGVGRNPKTGQEGIPVRARRKVRFKPGVKLKALRPD